MSGPTTKQLKEERTEDGWIKTMITPVINLNIKPHGHGRFRPSAYSFPPKVSYDLNSWSKEFGFFLSSKVSKLVAFHNYNYTHTHVASNQINAKHLYHSVASFGAAVQLPAMLISLVR